MNAPITIRDCIMRRFCKVTSQTWLALSGLEVGHISRGKALEIIREECERMERENFPELEAEIARLRAQLAASEADRWQDIETAPKDGTRLLLFPNYDGEVGVGWWNSDDDDFGDFEHSWQPVKWQPLPQPPARKALSPQQSKTT